MTLYEKIISEATGEADLSTLQEIEGVMRDTIFHSTLDWQTKAQLKKAARDAVKILKVLEEIAIERSLP